MKARHARDLLDLLLEFIRPDRSPRAPPPTAALPDLSALGGPSACSLCPLAAVSRVVSRVASRQGPIARSRQGGLAGWLGKRADAAKAEGAASLLSAAQSVAHFKHHCLPRGLCAPLTRGATRERHDSQGAGAGTWGHLTCLLLL